MKKGKPTSKEILELYEKTKKVYLPLMQDYKNDEKYYELDFKDLLNIPEEFKADGIVLPTARDMVDTFVDHIDVGNARIQVNKKGSSSKSEEAVEMQRKFAYGLIHRTKVEADISPWRVAAKHYAMHGLAVFKVLWDADIVPDGDSGDSEIPIVIQAVNPGCVFPDPGFGGREYVFEVHEQTVLALTERYSHFKNLKGKNIDEKIELVSFWSKKYHAEFADGQSMLKVAGGVDAHSYNFLPYVFIDTGLGNIDKLNDPRKRYVGILRYIMSLLVSESRNYSISDVVLALTAWPWGYLEGEKAHLVQKVAQKFVIWTKLPPGVKPIPMTPQVPPRALSEHLDRTFGYISGHAAPPSLRGMPEEGVRSAADRRLMIAEGGTKYKYSEEAFRNGTAKVLDLATRLMKYVVPDTIRVWAMPAMDDIDVEVKKDLLIPPFTYYVEFAPVSEEDEYRRHDDLERLVNTGIIPPEFAWKQMSNVNPEEMEMMFEKYKIANDPNLQQVLIQYALGLAVQAIQTRMAAEGAKGQLALPGMGGAQQGGGPPGGEGDIMGRMTTGIPNTAQLGSAASLQNALKQLRSGKPMNPMQGLGGGGAR